MKAQGLLIISIGFCLKQNADYELLTYGSLYVFEMPVVPLTVCLIFLLTSFCFSRCIALTDGTLYVFEMRDQYCFP